jgi:hypothetical protein
MVERWAYGIIAAKRRDSQASLLAMASSKGVAQSTIYGRARSCTRFITRHTVLLDFKELGLVQYLFIIRPFQHKRKRSYDYMSKHKCVNCLYILSGSDLIGEAIFADCITAEDFFDHLESTLQLGSVERFLIQQDILRESYIPEWRGA